MIKDIIKRLAKRVLIPLGLTAVASAAVAEIHKKILGSDRSSAPKTMTLIISNDKIKDIIEIVQSLEDCWLLSKGVSKTIQNQAKDQNGRFLSMLLGTVGASLFGNILAAKGINRAGEGILRAGFGNKKGRNFEKQKYYQSQPRFNGVYSRDNLP